MIAGSAEVIQIELNGYQVLWTKDNKQRTKYAKCAINRALKSQRGIEKSSLVEEESDMKRNEFETLALLRRQVKEMRANGEMDAQHDAGAAKQPQEQIEEVSRDFKFFSCEF